jgi:hypothetical protein
MLFNHPGDAVQCPPRLLHSMPFDLNLHTWRTHDCKEMLFLASPLTECALPSLVNDEKKTGLWFVPDQAPARVELAPGGAATVDGAPAWWGWTQPAAGNNVEAAVLVMLIHRSRGSEAGNEPVVLRELGPGMWRCTDQIVVLVEDNAPSLRLQPSGLSRFVPHTALAGCFLWLIPGQKPQGVILTVDGRMTWSELGGLTGGQPKGHWERLVDNGQEYLSFNFYDFGNQCGLRSVVLKRATTTSFAWLAVGRVDEFGILNFELPQMFPEWYVVALCTVPTVKRPRP